MNALLKVAAVAATVAVALAGITTAEAAKKKASKRKLTPAQKVALMPKAKAMCLATKKRGSAQVIRVEITDDGRVRCWGR